MNKNIILKKNSIVLGSSGKGHAIHPWDSLKKCNCSGIPWISGKDGVFESGFPYQIYCLNCSKRTIKGALDEVIKVWNEQISEK